MENLRSQIIELANNQNWQSAINFINSIKELPPRDNYKYPDSEQSIKFFVHLVDNGYTKAFHKCWKIFNIEAYLLADIFIAAKCEANMNVFNVYDQICKDVNVRPFDTSKICNPKSCSISPDHSDKHCQRAFALQRFFGSPHYYSLAASLITSRPHLLEYILPRILKDVIYTARYDDHIQILINKLQVSNAVCERILNALPFEHRIWHGCYVGDPYFYNAFTFIYHPEYTNKVSQMILDGTIVVRPNVMWTVQTHHNCSPQVRAQIRTFLLVRHRLLKKYIPRDILPMIFTHILRGEKYLEREVMRRRYHKIKDLAKSTLHSLRIKALDLHISPFLTYGVISPKIYLAAKIVDRKAGVTKVSYGKLVKDIADKIQRWRDVNKKLAEVYPEYRSRDRARCLVQHILDHGIKLSIILNTEHLFELIPHLDTSHMTLIKRRKLNFH
jgi:hypothetical protein